MSSIRIICGFTNSHTDREPERSSAIITKQVMLDSKSSITHWQLCLLWIVVSKGLTGGWRGCFLGFLLSLSLLICLAQLDCAFLCLFALLIQLRLLIHFAVHFCQLGRF